MNGDVTRLAEDLRRHVDDARGDELAMRLRGVVFAFIGRVAVRENGYAPAEEMLPVLKEGRDTVASMLTHGVPAGLRSELLRELDRALAVVTPSRFPINKLQLSAGEAAALAKKKKARQFDNFQTSQC